MKNFLLFASLVLFLISCKKEDYFIDQYQMISGIWNLQFISYDSSGVKITKTLSYNRLVIKDNLEYQIYNDQINQVEHGTINIITQTNNKLELYFDAQWPGYSSFYGSHVFGFTNVELVSLSDKELIIKTINAAYAEYSDREIVFKR